MPNMDASVKTYRMCNTKSEPQCMLLVLLNNNVSILVTDYSLKIISCKKYNTPMLVVSSRGICKPVGKGMIRKY